MFWEAGTYLALGAHRGLAGKMSLLLILSPPGTCSSKCPKTLPLFLGCAAEGVRPFPLQVPKKLPGPILPHRSGLRGKDLQIKANFLVIPGFSKAGSAPIPASCPGQHWGNTVHVSPSLPFSYTDHTNTRCVSAGHFTDDFFPHFHKTPPG